MSEEKAFDATPHRLAQAKRDGDVARSNELTAVASFVAAAMCVCAIAPSWAALARVLIANAAHGQVGGGAYGLIALEAVTPAVAASTSALAVAGLQGGGLAMRALQLKIEALNPISGVKRMFSRDAILAAVRATLAASTASVAVGSMLPRMLAPGGGSFPALTAMVVGTLITVFFSLAVVGSTFGVADALSERLKWRKRLRMSYDELKRDNKQHEGDPHVRSRRRQAHRALIRGSISRLKDASFIVTNPTHVAVALAYRPPAIAVPQVLIRSIDAGARAVKARARHLGIPIVENAPLARTLLATCDVGAYIPRELYVAMAEIVAALAREHV